MIAARTVIPLLALLLLAGCVEVDETWDLDSEGGGIYALRVRWNADLRNRLTGIVGHDVAARFEGRAFPLDADTWREGLRGREGLAIEVLEETQVEGGLHEISLRLRFRALEDLFGWELLARRSFDLRFVDPAAGEELEAERAGDRDRADLAMDPFAHVPVLDPLADALDAYEAADPRTPDAALRREPSPFDRWRIAASQADLVATILAPHVGKVRLDVTVRPSGTVDRVNGEAVGARDEAVFRFDFETLRRRQDRTLRMRWRPRLLDRVVRLRHDGDAPRHAPVR